MAQDSSAKFEASKQLAGYLYQCRYALYLILQRIDELDTAISVESLDDIMLEMVDSSPELIQTKHHAGHSGSLGNRSADIWKTIRVWSEYAKQGRIQVPGTILTMVTTTHAPSGSMASLLRDDELRDPETVFKEFNKIAKETSNDSNAPAYQAFLDLDESTRHSLVSSMHLIDGAPILNELQKQIHKQLHFASDIKHIPALAERLEGFWFNLVINSITSKEPVVISARVLDDYISELREQFKRDSLPADFLSPDVSKLPEIEDDARTFIGQLRLIALSARRLQTAQIDHYKAFSQRSRWIKDDLINLKELEDYEARLFDIWNNRFESMLDEIQNLEDGAECEDSGRKLYTWLLDQCAMGNATAIRSHFLHAYVSRGSYQMLSDQLRVGWHPNYDSILKNS